ncbi:MAG TPA: XdhC/CoxI family protein [Desulfatiglandales bacterium]|nr:XdhC/CoxI family protein [Desulfatiglandales bacterium]
MEDIFQEIVRIRSEGQRAALATVISTKGSTPRETGAKMLIRSDGTILGSIGGGSLEAQVCKEAITVMSENKSTVLRFDLTGKEVAEEGMICGGNMEVFVEPILPEPCLFIFGAGHISLFLAKMGKIVGFKVVVIDDRPEFANRERFPEADEVIAQDLPLAFPQLTTNRASYIAIVTRGHLQDETVLEWAVKTDAAYIGMIGSKKKNQTVFSHLKARGIPEKRLKEVHAPIGLNINAKTPEEIAVSIIAEIIKARRQGDHTVKTWEV